MAYFSGTKYFVNFKIKKKQKLGFQEENSRYMCTTQSHTLLYIASQIVLIAYFNMYVSKYWAYSKKGTIFFLKRSRKKFVVCACHGL